MQERRIVSGLEERVLCKVTPVKDVFPEIKPCQILCNGGTIYCLKSKALNCNDYILNLVMERQKYHGDDD